MLVVTVTKEGPVVDVVVEVLSEEFPTVKIPIPARIIMMAITTTNAALPIAAPLDNIIIRNNSLAAIACSLINCNYLKSEVQTLTWSLVAAKNWERSSQSQAIRTCH